MNWKKQARLAVNALPTIVIAGVTSGVGKTTISTAIMYLLRQKGMQVQPFKVGPDFIDPTYHNYITGRQSRNLDVWMMGKNGIANCFEAATIGADVAVIEGVMGLFDGFSGKNNFASTAHVATLFDSPVILVIDAAKAARSLAAIVMGFLHFDKKVRIAGLIFNNVAGEKHANYIREAMAGRVKIPVLGMIKRDKEIRLGERHLGLIPTVELSDEKKKEILNSSKIVSEQMDSENLSAILVSESKNRSKKRRSIESAADKNNDDGRRVNTRNVRIAVALDESFNFYYADNLDSLRRHGAEIVFFSPVNDSKIPEGISGLILGGGFPEVLAGRLEGNRSMANSIRKSINDSIPVYGECGGLMYLTKSIIGYKGEQRARKMLGIIDADTIMTNGLILNYTQADYNGPIFGKTGTIRGHEFHYSRMEDIAKDSKFAYKLKRGKGIANGMDGFIIGDNGVASYMHLHFADKRIPRKIVATCIRYSRR